MELDFWEQRWNQNQIAFHLDSVNPYLEKYWRYINTQKNAQVFVPLCGKSLDLIWLAAQGHSVLGVECSDKAINAFFEEQKISANINQTGRFKEYKCDNITLLQGDFFNLKKEDLKDVSVVYDRASLIALPEQMRQSYVDFLNENLPLATDIFLITLDYNQSLMSGPPFSVMHNEVVSLFQKNFNIKLLNESDVLEEHQKFKERGLDYLTERVYKLSRNC